LSVQVDVFIHPSLGTPSLQPEDLETSSSSLSLGNGDNSTYHTCLWFFLVLDTQLICLWFYELLAPHAILSSSPSCVLYVGHLTSMFMVSHISLFFAFMCTLCETLNLFPNMLMVPPNVLQLCILCANSQLPHSWF